MTEKSRSERGGRRRFNLKRREACTGWLFVSPALIGFSIFTFGSILYSLYLSFTDYNLLSKPNWLGLQNYVKAFTDDQYFYPYFGNTFYFVVALVPIVLVLFLGMIAFIVFMNDAERRIPVQYAKRVVGRKMYGGQNTYIPIKVNMSGVMPIILAVSILSIPSILATFFNWDNAFIRAFSQSSWLYLALYFVMIIGFAFFYVTIQYNPLEMANNLRKNSGAIPGYRPGKPTVDYIKRVLNKVTLIGSLFLGVIAVFPGVFGRLAGQSYTGLTLGGTSIMIIVGVALETTQQIESQMMMRHYKGFLE